jgi:PAS domain S-box-containing protein
LRKNEDHIHVIIDTIPTMAWTVTPDGVVDFANTRWLDYAGQDHFSNPNGIIHPEDLPGVMADWYKHKTLGESFDHEMRLRGSDGIYRWFLVRTAPFYDAKGHLIKWYGISIDIEDNKRAQDELRLAYRRLSYHVENTPLAVIEWDKNLFVKRWSVRAEEIFGWKEVEAIGMNLFSPAFPIVYEPDREAVTRASRDLLEGTVDRNLTHNHNHTKDGGVIYCEWYNSVLRDDDGNVVTILSLVQDITEREKADKTLKESYEKIRRLSEHLQNIREEERTYMAREIHDELGGQLTVLKMDASWLNQALAGGGKPVKQRLRNLIHILNAMLKSVRRISSQLRPSQLDNLGLIAAMEWHVKEFEKRSGVGLTFKRPKTELQITEALKNGLFRILQESLTNVARHSGAKHVDVELKQSGDELVLSIVDDGRGFDHEKAAEERTLGILGMKERTITLGGSYEIISEPGKGTRVTVALPSKAKILGDV